MENGSMFASWAFWLILALILMVGEILSPGLFIFFFFGLAALITMVFAFFFPHPGLLLFIYALSCGILLLAIRPVTRRLFLAQEKVRPSNVQALVGSVGYIVKEVKGETQKGTISIQGEEWSCIAEEEEEIASGEKARVLSVSGNKLVVTKLKGIQQ